ncbi:AraC family transcriptional regulator [Streptomyces longispororuber]|uniref:AraC family transcriptional regulator n=1 Tax=Streptomyces longispororuber TaxID=68230 RepID=A0A918ZD76_9ACTN|nr:AraC family transcriptional regulator [Streptomyces longispororuber]
MFRSDDLPPGERLARFEDFLGGTSHPMRVTTADPARFRATVRVLDLGPVSVVHLTCSPAVVWRTERLIRRADPELCSVLFPHRGALRVAQARREADLRGRDFALCDSSLPFRVLLSGHGTPALVQARVPRALLPAPVRRTGHLLGRRLPGREGLGALLTQFLTDVTAAPAPYTGSDVSRLSSVALDLLATVLAHHADEGAPEREEDGPAWPRDGLGRAQGGPHELLPLIEAFIEEHLADPDLSPATVAAAHHISVRYLHRLFQLRDTTVTELIRGRRLERARHDLADPRLGDLPVHRVAARWGFVEHSAFTRAFRTAYGMPPRDYRQRARRVPADPPGGPPRLPAARGG